MHSYIGIDTSIIRPSISIIIPARNEADFLSGCLASLHALEGNFETEIIVVNNGSTDATRAIAEGFGAIVIDEPMLGVGRARKTGTDAARGTYILHIDADTRLPQTFLTEALSYLCAHPNIACLGGQCVYYDAPRWKNMLRMLLFLPTVYFAFITSLGCIGPMGNCMLFRKSDYQKIKGFDPNLHYGEDADVCRQLSKFGRVVIAPRLHYGISVRRFYFDKNFFEYVVNFFYLCFTGRPKYNNLPPPQRTLHY